MRQRNREAGDFGGLRCRFGDDGIAGDQRSGDLADEDGEREIPGCDGGKSAAADEVEFVAFTGRARQHGGREQSSCFGGIVAAEIHRFADFAKRVGDGFAGLMDEHGHEGRRVALEQVGEPIEYCGAGGDRGGGPGREGGVGGGQSGGEVGAGIAPLPGRASRVSRPPTGGGR